MQNLIKNVRSAVFRILCTYNGPTFTSAEILRAAELSPSRSATISRPPPCQMLPGSWHPPQQRLSQAGCSARRTVTNREIPIPRPTQGGDSKKIQDIMLVS